MLRNENVLLALEYILMTHYVAYVLSCVMVATFAFPFPETFMVHTNAWYQIYWQPTGPPTETFSEWMTSHSGYWLPGFIRK